MASHPFFDAPTFPWSRPEAGPFHVALANNVPKKTAEVVFEQCGGNPIGLDWNQSQSDVWRDVLKELSLAGGLKNLCEWCRDHATYRNEPFQKAARAVLDAQYAPPRRVLKSGETPLLMFDRSALWDAVDRLRSTSDRARMLIIGGDQQSGKSHVSNLFELIADERGRQTRMMTLKKELVTNVEEVVDFLASRIGATIDVPHPEPVAIGTPDTSSDAWYKKVINKMLRAAQQSRTEWWIVVDDLGYNEKGDPFVDETVRQFFKQFGHTFADREFRQWFRLMLIGLPAQGATRWDRSTYLSYPPLSEADVKHEHVAEAVEEEARRKDKAKTPEAVKEIVDHVFAAAQRKFDAAVAAAKQAPELEPPSWLRCLHDEAVTALKAL